MFEELVEEFIVEIEVGFGFIFEADVKKYWNQAMGDYVNEEDYPRLLDKLREHNLLR